MGFTKYDKSYWVTIFTIMGLVAVSIVVIFFPIFEFPLCTDTGCTETNIQKSLYEIWLEQQIGINING